MKCIPTIVGVCITAIVFFSYATHAEERGPFSFTDIEALLTGQVSPIRIIQLMKLHGVEFVPTEKQIVRLELLGATDDMVTALQRASIGRGIDEDRTPKIHLGTEGRTPQAPNKEMPPIKQTPEITKERGSIYIETEPANAEIHVNGKYAATSPAEISLPVGQYTMVLIKQDYKPHSLSINIKRGVNLPVTVQLYPK